MTLEQHKTGNLTRFSEKDLEVGFKTFLANTYCPDKNVAKVYLFLRNLLSHHTPRTIIQAIINLVKSETIQGTTSQDAANKFYKEMDAFFHFDYGKNLLATSSRAQLQEMINKDHPFFTDHKLDIHSCLMNNMTSCHIVNNIVENLGENSNNINFTKN